MSTILHYNSFCLCIVCSFLIEVITINILAILNHLCIVKSLHIFLERWEAILLSFLSYCPNYRDKNISIKSTVVLLRFPQWASFPIWHLFDLAYRLFENFGGNLCQSSLLLNQEHLSVVALSINEILNVLYEVKVRELTCELLNVRWESKSNNCRVSVAEDLSQHLIKDQWFLEAHEIDQKSIMCPTYLEETWSRLMVLRELRPPLRVHTNKFIIQQDLKFLDILISTYPFKTDIIWQLHVIFLRPWKLLELIIAIKRRV